MIIKRFSIFLLFLFLVLTAKGQTRLENQVYKSILQKDRVLQNYAPKSKQQDSCKLAIKNAFADAQNSTFKYTRYGHTGGWPIEYLAVEILKKYNIKIDFPGCIATTYARCYDTAIEPFIEEKYSKTIEDIIDEEKFNFYTSIGRRNATYPGGDNKLKADLSCLINADTQISFYSVKLIINQEGKITEVIGNKEEDDSSKLKILKAALDKVNYYPALKDFLPIEGYDILYFTFDPKSKSCK